MSNPQYFSQAILSIYRNSSINQFVTDLTRIYEKAPNLDSAIKAATTHTNWLLGIEPLEATQTNQKKDNKIPNIIHSIWAGGNNIPKKEIENLKGWKEKCPDYEVILWTDKQTTSPKALDEIKKLAQEAGISVRDINEVGVVTPSIRHELDSVNPNYGLSSDLLRYKILLKFGGLYIDGDVACARPLPRDIYAPHGFMIPPWTQGHCPSVGNDIIFAVPNSDIIRKLSELSEESYKTLVDNEEPRPPFSLYHALNPMAAIMRTGPQFIVKSLKNLGYIKCEKKAEKSKIINDLASAGLIYKSLPDTISDSEFDIYSSYYEFKTPKGETNYTAWLKPKDPYFIHWKQEDQLIKMADLIQFEAENLRSLTLSKYINYIRGLHIDPDNPIDFSPAAKAMISGLMNTLSERCKINPNLMRNIINFQLNDEFAQLPTITQFLVEHVTIETSPYLIEHIEKLEKELSFLKYVSNYDLKNNYPELANLIKFLMTQYGYKNESTLDKAINELIDNPKDKFSDFINYLKQIAKELNNNTPQPSELSKVGLFSKLDKSDSSSQTPKPSL